MIRFFDLLNKEGDLVMKSILIVALAITVPSIGSSVEASSTAHTKRQKKFCTQVRAKSGSRVNQRICLTQEEWRKKLGNDWRDQLTGSDVNANLDDLELKAKMGDPPVRAAPPR